MRWYITAAITSTKTIKILSNIHSIEAAQCFSLNLNLQAPSPPGCVETRGSGDPAPLFLWGSGEAGAKTRGANQIDCSQDVVGEYAQGGFGFDLIETSGGEAPARCHSFDSSKWVLGRASPPPHEARIGLDARIHALYYTVPEMRPTIPNPNWTGDVNGWGRGL